MRSYDVETICSGEGCGAAIDMGMAYRCDGCGDHYCSKHLIHQVCGYCANPTPGQNWVYDR